MTKIVSYRKGGRDMRIAKKVIVLLCIMLGMLFFNTLRVEAKEIILKYNNKEIDKNDEIEISFSDYTNKDNKLYCVEKGDYVNRKKRKYKVIGRVDIKDNVTTIEYGKEKHLLDSSDSDKKLAMAIATMKSEDLKYFLWGYFGTWVEKLNKDNNNIMIPENFARKVGDLKSSSEIKEIKERYQQLCNELEDKIDESVYQIDDKLSVEASSARFRTKMMDGTEYTRIGPFKMKGKPSRSKIRRI